MSVDHRNCTRIDVDEFFKCRREPSFKKWSRSLTGVVVYPGGGTSHMKGVGMLVGNFGLNPQRRPIWAWPKLFLTPKRDQKNIHIKSVYFYIFSLATLNETFTAKYDGVFPRTPLGPVQTSCFCRAELNSGIKFDKSTTEARRLNQTFELSSASN